MIARDLTLTQAGRAARNAGMLVRADEGSAHSAIALYSAQGGALLALRHLAKPCGTLREADGRIELLADTSATDLVVASGGATWGEWLAGDGAVLAGGQVTDEEGKATGAGGALVDTSGTGPWVLKGTSGTQLYEGGAVLLHSAVIG